MNIVRNRVVCIGIALVVSALIGTGAAQVSQSGAGGPAPAQHLTHKQADHLISAASAPGDHRQLAQYFREEAQRNIDKERYYSEMAATYRVHPPRVDMYRNVSTHGYYEHLADEARAKAIADDQLASYQDNLAAGIVQAK